MNGIIIVFLGLLIGIGLVVYGLISIISPRSVWWMREFSNESKGIQGTKPNSSYDMLTRLKGSWSFFVGLAMVIAFASLLSQGV